MFSKYCETENDSIACEGNENECIWCANNNGSEKCISRPEGEERSDSEICETTNVSGEFTDTEVTGLSSTFLGEKNYNNNSINTGTCGKITKEYSDELGKKMEQAIEEDTNPNDIDSLVSDITSEYKEVCTGECTWDDDKYECVENKNVEEGFALLNNDKNINLKTNLKDVGNESYKADTLMNNLERYLANMYSGLELVVMN